MISISMKNVTPLCQIEGGEKRNNVDTITTKKLTMLYEDMPVEVPIITANGFRGLLRRTASKIIFEKALEKGFKIDRSNFHLMFAGGGNNYQSVAIEVENKIRELNPVASLFGVSLAVEGKLIVTNLVPTNPLIRTIEKNDAIYSFSNLVKTMSFITVDDMLERTKFGRLMSKEDIAEWESFSFKNNAERKKARENDDEKVKKQTIKAYLQKEYVIPNTEFVGNIHKKMELTDIEYGLLIKALLEITKEQIGSTKNLGFGIMEHNFEFDSGATIISNPNERNLFVREDEVNLFEEEEKALKAFNEWLENIDAKNIEITQLLT